jgi:peptidoglycan/xylan/chitin deacetylase (PgdA/CDA1 family)
MSDNSIKYSILLYLFALAVNILIRPKNVTCKYFANSITTMVRNQHKTDNSPKNLSSHEVPVLCYHQIRDWQTSDSKNARVYIMPVDRFKDQMKMLADSGYHVILPDELMDYFTRGIQLPFKPVILTFDDGTASQFSNAIPVLNKYHFKAVFFIMTVSLNHSIYMSDEQVETLSDNGHIIACHTWDHHNVTGYNGDDWKIQFENPKHRLEKITGRPVKYFAYPNGLWNEKAIEALKLYGFAAAFQLTGKKSTTNSVFTLRRIIVDGNWNEKQLLNTMKSTFK